MTIYPRALSTIDKLQLADQIEIGRGFIANLLNWSPLILSERSQRGYGNLCGNGSDATAFRARISHGSFQSAHSPFLGMKGFSMTHNFTHFFGTGIESDVDRWKVHLRAFSLDFQRNRRKIDTLTCAFIVDDNSNRSPISSFPRNGLKMQFTEITSNLSLARIQIHSEWKFEHGPRFGTQTVHRRDQVIPIHRCMFHQLIRSRKIRLDNSSLKRETNLEQKTDDTKPD